MSKKIIFFILLFNLIGYASIASSEIVPLKKPIQTKEETQKKLLIDVLKPLPKPIEQTEKKVIEEKVIVEKESENGFILPKKKPLIAGTEKVKDITNGVGVPVVYDGVGKKTFDGSIECLKVRGMMVSFGNASGPIEPCNVGKSLAPKGLYLTRPSIAHYTTTKEELDEAAKKVFEMFINKKFKLNIFKKYSLDEIVKAHQDLESRKILGPAIIIP